jgi:HEAT repeat protein
MRTALFSMLIVATLLGCSGSKDEVQYRGQSLRQWIRLLEGPGEVQLMTLEEFRKSTPEEARAILPELRILLQDQEEDVRNGALTLLGELGRNAEDAVPLIAEALKDPSASIRNAAAKALYPRGPAARQAVPALLDALGDPDSHVKMSAAGTLGAFRDRAFAPPIATLLKDENRHVRGYAAITLEKLGPLAVEAIPALEEALNDPDAGVLKDVARALKSIRNEPHSDDGS